jgi:hypothetical protein
MMWGVAVFRHWELRTEYSVLASRYSNIGRYLIVCVLPMFLTGCRADPYKLVEARGTVTTCEGKPAAGGTIVFYPVDDPESSGRKAGNPGREARGAIGEDGSFTLTTIGIKPAPGVVTGRHKVAFEGPPTRRPTLSADDKANMTPEEIQKNEADFASRKVYAPIPCSDKVQPEEVVVKAEGNQFEFKLLPK